METSHQKNMDTKPRPLDPTLWALNPRGDSAMKLIVQTFIHSVTSIVPSGSMQASDEQTGSFRSTESLGSIQEDPFKRLFTQLFSVPLRPLESLALLLCSGGLKNR